MDSESGVAKKSSKADLNIYLAKTEVKNPRDILKDATALNSITLSVTGINPCTLFVKNTFSNIPRWAKFFSPDVPAQEFGRNSSTAAVLFAKTGSAIFILTFGQGRHLVDSGKIEMNFGLRAALNLLDVSSIRSIDKASFEQYPTQTREQTGIATELQYFGLNIERDLLRAITGTPNDESFGKRISGMDSLKLSVEIELNELASLLKRVLTAYKDNAYKNGGFAWVDHIGQVKDKTLHEALDTEIVNRINSRHFDHIWLSVPEIIDWDRVVRFKYFETASSPRYYDIRISEFLDSFKGNSIDTHSLKQRRIFCIDAEDMIVYEGPVYRFVYAEVNYHSDIYVLNNGNWYKVNRGFAEQVNGFFSRVPKYGKTLPNYDDDTEGDYNKRVANEDPNSFVLLDKKNIRVTGAVSPVEPCDLYRNGNEFIHVKRYGGSSVLSHLFNQGLVSGELFQREPEFRKSLNSKLPTKFKLTNPNDRPNRNDYQVVFAIISESDEDSLNIPFFSKISLKHVLSRLQDSGFLVALAKISVDVMRKRTTKYSSERRKT